VSDLDASKFWLDALKWDENGMIPAIAQDAASGRVVMFAWMNRVSLEETVKSGNAVYWSRSRQRCGARAKSRGTSRK
jgi:phosphoribosyl-AMP cyclohydrolase